MSPPEVWGPAVWTLFHTLAEKLNSSAYNQVAPSMFNIIVQICKFLPCPECSRDASNFLAKLNLSDYKNKDDFKNMLYLFHNYVNAKKRKPLYNYAYMNKYSNVNLISVINNFIAKYNTKGNMNLIAESFQRSFVIKNFIAWFNGFKRAFIQPIILNAPERPVSKISINDNLPTIEESSGKDSPNEKSSQNEDTNVKEPIEESLIEEETFIEGEDLNESPKTAFEIKEKSIISKKGRKGKSKK